MTRSLGKRLNLAVLLSILCLAWAGAAHAQAGSTPSAHASGPNKPGPAARAMGANPLAKQLSALEAKIGALQVQLQAQQRPAAAAAGGGMGGMMGMCSKMMGGMGMPGGGGGAAMAGGMPGGGMMMGGMGAMPAPVMGASSMGMTSTLPGFPGASHLYHVGATDFFLDQASFLQLTAEQQMALNAIKQKALFEQADRDRQLAAAEQELWLLTSSDQPDSAKVEARIRSIEKLRADGRLALIRAVGEAAKGLTDQQRKVLAGLMPPAMAMPAAGMAGAAMPPGGGMMDDDMMMGGGSAPMGGGGTAPMGGGGMSDM